MDDGANRPIFIVGCQRSGTTLLRLILDAHPNIACGPETRFLEDLARITDDRQWRRMRLYGFPKEYWHERVAAMFDGFQSDYARARGKHRWADKTPRYALCIGYLDQLFPTCQVVHLIRDGRDVVASHRDRWGWRAALKAVRKWPRYIATARGAAAGLPAGRYHEVRYERLVADPEATLRELLDFLGEPWDPNVLEHDKRPHDVPERYLAFASSRRVATAERPAIYRTRVGAGRRELHPLLRLTVRLLAGRTLRELGYR